jgi:hypothetical protein
VRNDHTHLSLGSSNQIQGFVVVLIPLQITLSCILKHCQDNVPCLYNLLNSMYLTQHVVPYSVLPISEIFTIENHTLDETFLHVVVTKPVKDNY